MQIKIRHFAGVMLLRRATSWQVAMLRRAARRNVAARLRRRMFCMPIES
jgi:hypothetical protein